MMDMRGDGTRLPSSTAGVGSAGGVRGNDLGGTEALPCSDASYYCLSAAVLQIIVAAYSGYFGGSIGILMLTALGLLGMEDIHEMNVVKKTLASCVNGAAVVTFIAGGGGLVWSYALLIVVEAAAGGFGGASFARKLDPRLVRGFVIVVGCLVAVSFFPL